MRNTDIRSRALAVSLAGASMIPLAGTAHGQAADDAPGGQAEIVVTAKNRTEKLQDVPLSITALTTGALQDNQIRDVKDLQKVTPNLSIFSGSGRNDPSGWAMRGLTSNTSDERYQGISFFLDGIALSGQLASLDMDNIERVEVIKGPQSATFGRATYSGAVNFITKEPTGDTITGSVRARGSLFKGAGGEASYFLNASLTLPVVRDSLWLTVGGTTMRNGRVGRAVDSGQPIGRERTDVLTATLFWKPDDSLSISLRGLYTHDRDSIAAQIIQMPREWLDAGVPTVTLPRGGGAFLPEHLPDPDVRLVADKGRSGYIRDRYFGSLIVSKMVGDFEINYRGGYFRSEDKRDAPSFPRSTVPGQDPTFGSLIGTPAITLGSSANSFSIGYEVFQNTSHQLMLLSPGDQSLRWRVGGYYFWEKDDSGFLTSATPANPKGRIYIQSFENIAAFGGFDWDFAENLTLSGEARYAKETLKYPACTTCFTVNNSDFSQSSSDFTPRVTVSYKPAPDNMFYALYSRGVKSGRFSNITPPGGTQTVIYAQPEVLDNFEVGTKNSFAGGRVIVNLAGFFDKVSKQQLTSTTPYQFVNAAGQTVTGNITGTSNVGKSEIWGFELETTFRVTPQFTLEGAVGYAHQEFVNDQPVVLQASSAVGFPGAAGSPIIMKGKSQANVPRWNGYAAAQYVVPLGQGDLKLRADANYRGKLYADLANLTEIRSAWTINSRVSWVLDNWDVSLFARNIFNNQRATGSGLAGATSPCGFIETNTARYGTNQQCLYASPPRPRELGAEVSFRF